MEILENPDEQNLQEEMVAQNDQAIQSIMQEYVVNRNPRTTPSWVGFVGESEQRLVIQNKLQTLSRDNMME